MQLKALCCGSFSTNCYIISEGKEAYLVDAPSPAEKIIQALGDFDLRAIYLTHGHFDHIMALGELRQKYPDVKIAIGEKDAFYLNEKKCLEDLSLFGLESEARGLALPSADILLKEGDTTDFGARVIETGGHTMGSLCFWQEEEGCLFSGDTIFCQSVGRTDLGGDYSALCASLKKLFEIVEDSQTIILPGHGPSTTIGFEKKNNPWLQ